MLWPWYTCSRCGQMLSPVRRCIQMLADDHRAMGIGGFDRWDRRGPMLSRLFPIPKGCTAPINLWTDRFSFVTSLLSRIPLLPRPHFLWEIKVYSLVTLLRRTRLVFREDGC
jgi:hypothetical protein